MTSLALTDSAGAGAGHEARSALALQTADAGLNQYISRLVEDPLYPERFVDTAEDPRVAADGTVFAPGSPWTRLSGEPWTYQTPSAPAWRELQGGRYGRTGYRLRVVPPAVGSGNGIVTVEAIGRVGIGRNDPITRTIQSQIQPTSLADFQAISGRGIAYGSSAETTGKLFSEGDIVHRGVARERVYARNLVCTSSSSTTCSSSSTPASTFRAEPQGAFDRTTTPSVNDEIPSNINFGALGGASTSRIQAAAQASGGYFSDTGARGWLVQFLAGGTVNVHRITNPPPPPGPGPGPSPTPTDLGTDLGSVGPAVSIAMPATGALYFEQSVIVSSASRPSTVNGRATVATGGNVYIGGNIAYAQAGDDVLGLIGNEIIIGSYAPRELTFRAATLARIGQWHTVTGTQSSSHERMHYIGSQGMALGGFASMYQQRQYDWDETLAFLRPPFYPIIEGSYSTRYWREIATPG